MDDDRIPAIIYKWDRSLKTNACFGDLRHILAYANIECDFDNECIDLDVLACRLLYLNRQSWWQTACTEPKLCTFIEIFNKDQPKALVKSNLRRRHRSLIAKLKCGVLPIAIETRRFKNVPHEIRFCRVCDGNIIESEYHHLLHCEKLEHVRDRFKAYLFNKGKI